MNTQTDSNQTDWGASHQVGHDVVVAFHVFPHADNLREATKERKKTKQTSTLIQADTSVSVVNDAERRM